MTRYLHEGHEEGEQFLENILYKIFFILENILCKMFFIDY